MQSSPLNVLWLIDHVCYDGSLHGGGRLFMNLVPRFDPARVRVHPYFLRAAPEVEAVFAQAGHPVRNLDLGKYDPLSPWVIDRLCRKHDIDVMHLFCYAASTLGRLVGTVRRIPTIVQDFETSTYFSYPLYLKLIDRVLAARTDRAFAASAVCRDYMHDVRQIPRERVELFHHAVPDSLLLAARNSDRAAMRAQIGVGDEFVVSAITKLGPDRGNETLLRAFAEVRKRVPDARLFIVYKPTLYHRIPDEYAKLDWIRSPAQMLARVERMIAELSLGHCVTLVESLERPEPYYAASDLLVAPFEALRFSSVNLIEGMAFGCPHVASDLGEPAELVDRYHAGIKVPPKNAEALAAAIERVATDRALREELGRNAKRAAVADLTAAAAVDRFSRLYAKLANPPAETPQAVELSP